jgi:hypothetical protein
VHQSTEKPDFPTVVLFLDEACCTRQGIFNSHKSHVWAEANPHAASVHCHQQRFVVNVWVDNDFLIGPYLLPWRLSAWIYRYHKYWRKSCCQSGEIWFQTGLRLSLHVTSENISLPLTTIIGLDMAGQWLGLPGHWTSHQKDFFLWGHTETLIYMLLDLIVHIVEAAATIRQQPGIFECTSVSAVSPLAVYRGQWPNDYTSALNWYEVQLFVIILRLFCLISNFSQAQFDGL